MWGLAFDSHGDTKGANFQVADLSAQNELHEISGLIGIEVSGTLFAATDFFDVMTNAHAGILA